MNNILIWLIFEIIIFLTFIFVCGALTRSRFSAGKTALIILLFTMLSAVLNTAAVLYSHDAAFTYGLFPVTVYLPAIIALHIISDSRFFSTVSIWCIGLFSRYAGKFLLKMIITTTADASIPYYVIDIMELMTLLIVMSIICIVTIKYIRKPFNLYICCSDTGQTAPTMLLLLILAVFSYISNSTYDHIISILLFLLTIMAFFVIARLLSAEYARSQLTKEHDEYENRIKTQHEEFKELTRKHEMFREYRHDMRHHLLALDNILKSSDNSDAEEYIGSLIERLEDTENVVYCKNQMINTILNVYIPKAKKTGCVVDTNISVPENTDIDDTDLCVVLSNALENAVNACEKEDENNRLIKIKISFDNVLGISIKNTCTKDISFDKNGIPVTASGKDHGIGMKSIGDTVKKYNGIFKCKCTNGEFCLDIVMFSASPNENKSHAAHTHKPVSAIFFSLICICVFLNVSPTVAEALADIPIAGQVVRVITIRQHKSVWGANKLNVSEPEAEGKDEINDKIGEYIETLREKYIWYVNRKYMGYTAIDSTYTIICDNEKLLSIRFDSTLNAGGSQNFSRCLTLDKQTGKVLELSDLFLEGADYVTPISNDIICQMTMQSENGYGNYFIPGGIWNDDECFKSISENQNFYINHRGRLVIVFDEYEVAPGNMGCVEFTIPSDKLYEILSTPSLIQ